MRVAMVAAAAAVMVAVKGWSVMVVVTTSVVVSDGCGRQWKWPMEVVGRQRKWKRSRWCY